MNKKHKHCTSCLGSGKLVGLGSMKIECKSCLGVGYTVQDDADKRTEDEILHAPKISIEDIAGTIVKKKSRKGAKHESRPSLNL